jgi:uncharacterized protein
MSDEIPRVVLDTVVFIQCLIRGKGPSAGCMAQLRAGRFVLLMSDAIFDELENVAQRPRLVAKYPFLAPDKVSAFMSEIRSLAVNVAHPPTVFSLPRDPKDEPLIDLAIAGRANYLVTWNDRHLTYLMRQDTPEGMDFRKRFPNLKIVSPPDFLAAIIQSPPP